MKSFIFSFTVFYNDFLLLDFTTIYSFDSALSIVKNCADHLFEYFEILLFVRLWNIQEVKATFLTPAMFCFHRGQKAAEAVLDICMVYREGVIGESTARKWFAKFKNGNFDIDDMLHSGRPSEVDEDHLKALLKEESHQTSCELAEKINCSQKTILNHLHSFANLPKN